LSKPYKVLWHNVSIREFRNKEAYFNIEGCLFQRGIFQLIKIILQIISEKQTPSRFQYEDFH